MAALDELLELRLLAPTAVPRRFAFRHPLVRRAVYASTGGGWRMGAHGRAAASLAARGAAPVTRARHVEQSAVAGDPAAIALLLDAAAATAPRAPAAAARWFEAALRLHAEEDAGGRLSTLVGLAQVLRSTGDLEACAQRLGEALALVGDDDPGARVRLIAAAAAAEHFLGRHDAADRQLDAAYAALPDRDSEDALTVLFAQIAGAFFSLDVVRGCALSAEALAVAQRLGDPLLIGAGAAALAHAHANAGDVDAARSAVALAAERLDAADDEALGPPHRGAQPPGVGRAPDRARRRRHPPRDARDRHRARHGPGPVRPHAHGRTGVEHAAPGSRLDGARAPGGCPRDRQAGRQRLRDVLGAEHDGPHRDRAR